GEIGVENNYVNTFVAVGGLVNTVAGIGSGFNDFGILFDQTTGAPLVFAYAVPGFPGDVFMSETGTLTFTGGSVAAVPLPAALPLFATRLGALGLLWWRRKRKALAAFFFNVTATTERP